MYDNLNHARMSKIVRILEKIEDILVLISSPLFLLTTRTGNHIFLLIWAILFLLLPFLVVIFKTIAIKIIKKALLKMNRREIVTV